MRVASRQCLEDLTCDVEVGSYSDSLSGSTREIKIESLVSSSRVLNVCVLNTLSHTITFTRASS